MCTCSIPWSPRLFVATPSNTTRCRVNLISPIRRPSAAHYGVDPADSANTILVSSKRPAGVTAACVVLATTRLDVNKKVCSELGVKKASFASAETTSRLTGMEIGGVTPFGLPDDMPILVDRAVMARPSIVLGGGNRTSKLRVAPGALLDVPGARVVDQLAIPAGT